MATTQASAAARDRRHHRDPEHREVTIGNFSRLGQIGQGSFATVYKAKHVVSASVGSTTNEELTTMQKRGTLVAIKSVILARLNKKLKDNLFSEINILRELHHPHIVGLFDCRETSANIHLVMEYCPMGDLAYFLRKREQYARHDDFAAMFRKYPNPAAGGLHEVLVRHFFQQLASALQFLRARDLIHRDVKPQNLLVVPPAAYYDSDARRQHHHDTPYFPSTWTAQVPVGVASLPVLKLADFGFARSLPKTTLAETLCGSPLYMAPEILRYEKYDAKADLWSVGTVTFEMLTGKPPFRAANHIELLRKIETTQDRIKFPDEPPVSADMQRIVSALLKRGPVERIGFDDFFADPTITKEIPGLAEEDQRRPSKQSRRSTVSQASEQSLRPPQPTRMGSSGRETNDSDSQEKFHDAIDYPSQQQPQLQRPPMRETATAPVGHVPQSSPKVSEQPTPPQSPSRIPNTTATTARRAEAAHTMRRTASREKQPPTIQETGASNSVTERAAQDVAFERDYVLVEKRAVEVNAFADEMAASPRVSSKPRSNSNATTTAPGALARRNTTQNTPPQTGGPATVSARPAQVVAPSSSRRPDHMRQDSLERRARHAASTTSAISKAVAMASGRLFGFGLSPSNLPSNNSSSNHPRGTPSPPVYGPFPSYPVVGSGGGGEGKGPTAGAPSPPPPPTDEDTKTLQRIEEVAHRSDVVFHFAEVKYKQLIPLAPSVTGGGDGLGLQQAGVAGKGSGGTPQGGGDDDDGLTPDAIVQLSEEAFVLYVKSLSLLAQSTDIAGAWWATKNHNNNNNAAASPPDGGGGGSGATHRSPATAAAAARMNTVVQWVRDRFNEVLEKAEFVRLKLLAAQKRLPSDHPAHPDNQPAVAGSGSAPAEGDVFITPGVTAERLMYERAREMGKSAAVNELVHDDLPGCEIAYATAIRLLEAVLDTADDAALPTKRAAAAERSSSGAAGPRGGNHDDDEVMQAGDREQIQKVVHGFHARLLALRQKLHVLADRQASVPGGTGPGSVSSKTTKSPAARSPVLGSVGLAAGGGGSSSSPRSR